MLTYKMTTANRKDLVKRLSELTEIPAKYMGVPSCGYQVGRYRIAKDGTLTVDDIAADTEMLAQLAEEGLITGEEQESTAETATEEAAVTEEAAETESEAEPETAVNSETDAAEEPGLAAEPAAGTSILRVSVPMAGHTGVSLRNLTNLLFSRGKLLRKATGGSFEVEAGLAKALEDDACTVSVEAFMRKVADYETEHGKSIYGLEISPEQITFIFGETDAAHADAFTKLAGMMNKQALTQNRIRAKEVDDSNEKYALRTWLLRIGMSGPDYKEARKILMENLGGHTAFRTPEEAERAKQKNLEKRQALKAVKAAGEAGGNGDAGENADGGSEAGIGTESAEAETTAQDTQADAIGAEETPQD